MADAVYDLRARTGDAGVCAFSARADTDSGLVLGSDGDMTGGLVYAVFGADSSPVTALTLVENRAGKPGFSTYEELLSRAT